MLSVDVFVILANQLPAGLITTDGQQQNVMVYTTSYQQVSVSKDPQTYCWCAAHLLGKLEVVVCKMVITPNSHTLTVQRCTSSAANRKLI